MKEIPLAELKNRLSQYLREAEKEPVVVTRHGRPAGVLLGFADDDDWFDFRIEHDPRFRARMDRACRSVQDGKGIPWEKIKAEEDKKR